jgi:hypothetical protein
MALFGERVSKKPKGEKPATTFAKLSCQLFGNLLALLERAATDAKPDYTVILRYAVAIIALNYHSRHINSPDVAAVIEEANRNAARSIAHTLENEARIDDRAAFYDRYMAVTPATLADEIESLVLDMVTGKDDEALTLVRRYTEEALGAPPTMTDEAFREYADVVEDRIMISSKVVMKNL